MTGPFLFQETGVSAKIDVLYSTSKIMIEFWRGRIMPSDDHALIDFRFQLKSVSASHSKKTNRYTLNCLPEE